MILCHQLHIQFRNDTSAYSSHQTHMNFILKVGQEKIIKSYNICTRLKKTEQFLRHKIIKMLKTLVYPRAYHLMHEEACQNQVPVGAQ